MDAIRISSPAAAISYMGHSLGCWPKEGVVCVALDGTAFGHTLRVNIPGTTAFIKTHAERLAHYFGIDHDATAVLIALFTHQPWGKGHPKAFATMIQGLNRQSSAAGLLLHRAWIVGPTSFAPYAGTNPTTCGKETPAGCH